MDSKSVRLSFLNGKEIDEIFVIVRWSLILKLIWWRLDRLIIGIQSLSLGIPTIFTVSSIKASMNFLSGEIRSMLRSHSFYVLSVKVTTLRSSRSFRSLRIRWNLLKSPPELGRVTVLPCRALMSWSCEWGQDGPKEKPFDSTDVSKISLLLA